MNHRLGTIKVKLAQLMQVFPQEQDKSLFVTVGGLYLPERQGEVDNRETGLESGSRPSGVHPSSPLPAMPVSVRYGPISTGTVKCTTTIPASLIKHTSIIRSRQLLGVFEGRLNLPISYPRSFTRQHLACRSSTMCR